VGVIASSGELVGNEDAAGKGVEDSIDPTARSEESAGDAKEGVGQLRAYLILVIFNALFDCRLSLTSHGHHSAHGERKGQHHIDRRIHDHELRRA
jgi:hypothetical protein